MLGWCNCPIQCIVITTFTCFLINHGFPQLQTTHLDSTNWSLQVQNIVSSTSTNGRKIDYRPSSLYDSCTRTEVTTEVTRYVNWECCIDFQFSSSSCESIRYLNFIKNDIITSSSKTHTFLRALFEPSNENLDLYEAPVCSAHTSNNRNINK